MSERVRVKQCHVLFQMPKCTAGLRLKQFQRTKIACYPSLCGGCLLPQQPNHYPSVRRESEQGHARMKQCHIMFDILHTAGLCLKRFQQNKVAHYLCVVAVCFLRTYVPCSRRVVAVCFPCISRWGDPSEARSGCLCLGAEQAATSRKGRDAIVKQRPMELSKSAMQRESRLLHARNTGR